MPKIIPFQDNHFFAGHFILIKEKEIFSLLPLDHARHYPLSFTEDKKILNGVLNFYNEIIFNNYNSSNLIEENEIESIFSQKNKQLIILNILDNCFGHSLLKLFHATKFYKNYLEYDFLIIIPSSLKHYVRKSSGINQIIIKQNFKQIESCKILNSIIHQFTQKYSASFIGCLNTYNSYNEQELINTLELLPPTISSTKPKKDIIFYYRSDFYRKWCGNKQHKKIIALFSLLKSFFEGIDFIILGEKDKIHFPPWIKDERINGYSELTDFYYNRLFNESIITVGLTGSHMLFPSLFSKMTVHLIPSYKIKNLAEDIVPVLSENSSLNAYKHLYYYGNYNCSNISSSTLAIKILVHFQGAIEKEYKYSDSALGQEAWVKERYPFFNYAKVQGVRAKFNKSESLKLRFLYYLQKMGITIP